MSVTSLWTAVHYRIPLLIVVANNRSFYNDEVHQERMAIMRNRPVDNKWIGQKMLDPEIDIAALARAQGARGFGPITKADRGSAEGATPRRSRRWMPARWRWSTCASSRVMPPATRRRLPPRSRIAAGERRRIGDSMAAGPTPTAILGTAEAGDSILVVDDIFEQFETPEGPLVAVDHVSL